MRDDEAISVLKKPQEIICLVHPAKLRLPRSPCLSAVLTRNDNNSGALEE
jgi:hypothetical protein